MNRWIESGLLVLLLLCSSAGPALAQMAGSGVLTGMVKDAQGAILPGVAVTATSPALIGSQMSVTEANGVYRIPALPAGTYSLTFVLSGFRVVTRTNIALAVNQTLTVDVSLQLANVQENVTVSAEAPVVDVQSTSVGETLNTAKLIGVPTSTDLWGALAQTSGVRMRGFDVGGSNKMNETGYDSFGIRGQNRIILQGIDTTEGNGGAGNYMDYFAQSELSVTAAGGDVSMNTPGAAVIQTIKSGGNAFTSLDNLTYEGRNFVGNNIDEARAARGFTGQPNLLFWEGHADLGGPIKHDKLWFYSAYNHFKINKITSGIPEDVATDLSLFDSFTAKVTYKLGPKDTVVGFYNWNNRNSPLRGLSTTIGPDTALAENSPSWNYNGEYQRVWSNHLFTQFSVGTFGYDFPEVPKVDYRTNPPRQNTGTGVQTGAGWGSGAGPFDSGREKPQAFGNATYFLPTAHGNHDVKIGFEWLDDRSNNAKSGTSGAVLYLDRGNDLDEIRLTDVGDPSTLGSEWSGPSDRDRRAALYLQDRWTTGPMTLTMGVRYDRQRPYYIDAVTKPVLDDIFQAFTTPGRTLLVRNTVVPRLGLSWDPKGDGRSVAKVFYGRYYFNFASQFAGVDPGGTNTRDYVFKDRNGNRTYDGPQELGTLVGSTGGSSTTFDPDLKTPYTDEFDLSYSRQFWGESSIRFAYIRKMTRNDLSTYNVAREGQFTVPTTVPVTLQSFDGGVEDVRNFTVYDIPDSRAGVVSNEIANVPTSERAGAANCDTADVTFSKRYAQGLFVDTAFDYSWRNELRRNSASNNPTSSDPISTGYFQNVYPRVSNRQLSTYWEAHVSGRYTLPYEVGVGVNLEVQSGWPYTRLISVRLDNAGTQTFFMNNMDESRSDTTPLLDVRIDKGVTVVGGRRLTFMADLFNALNSNAVVNFNLANGARYNQINGTLDPRTAEIGVRFAF